MAKKMSKRLIALSSGIVATIYLLSYTPGRRAENERSLRDLKKADM